MSIHLFLLALRQLYEMNDALYHASNRWRIVMFDRFAEPVQT
jgi:hypothetical protein